MTLDIVHGRHNRHYWRDDAPDYLDDECDIEEADRREREEREMAHADFLHDERIERELINKGGL